jgi:hypothetical protein
MSYNEEHKPEYWFIDDTEHPSLALSSKDKPWQFKVVKPVDRNIVSEMLLIHYNNWVDGKYGDRGLLPSILDELELLGLINSHVNDPYAIDPNGDLHREHAKKLAEEWNQSTD